MTTRQWQRVKDLFDEATGVEPSRREALLRERGDGDELVVREALALLAAYTENHASPTATAADQHVVADKTAARLFGLGRSVGPYRLVRVLGEGGMGVVYLAERTEPIRQVVALKLIRAGLESRQALARFDAERQSLALMDHPNVAKVFDAGVDEDGRPYFVMEYVPGEPITAYCDAQRLGVRRRLELFTQACDAVGHAHQKAVIHRDLKPGNILVASVDDRPVVKVIDFGVARIIDGDAAARATTRYTLDGQWVGTPEYMSPEQAGDRPGDVDTRADVYSLGVVLYELLTGATPFEPTRLRGGAYADAQRIIREVDPPKPSRRLSAAPSLADVAACRRVVPRKLVRAVRGELDWIVMKALEKDRNRRYESVPALAADVLHHLAYEPVTAGPPSRLRRARKFVRRNRRLVGATAAVVTVGLLGASSGLWWEFSSALEAYKKELFDPRSHRERVPDGMLRSYSRMGLLLQEAGKFADAEQYLLTGFEGVPDDHPAAPRLRRRAVLRLIALYEDWNQPEQAAEWRTKLAAFPASGPATQPLPSDTQPIHSAADSPATPAHPR